jgi:hypothetical protein
MALKRDGVGSAAVSARWRSGGRNRRGRGRHWPAIRVEKAFRAEAYREVEQSFQVGFVDDRAAGIYLQHTHHAGASAIDCWYD